MSVQHLIAIVVIIEMIGMQIFMRTYNYIKIYRGMDVNKNVRFTKLYLYFTIIL